MRQDWIKEIEISQSGQPITPTLINNLAEIKTQGGDWKKVATDHALNSKGPFASSDASTAIPVNYQLSWVRPGVHALTPEDIMNQREHMSDDDFINLMTPYFARHEIIRDGMLELRALFLGTMQQHPDGFRRRHAPAQPVTYHKMLLILRRICDRIPRTEDTYPDEMFRLNARDRYRRSLKSGNRMPLMAEEEEAEEVTIVRSNKRAFSEPDGLQTHALKRRRGGDRGRGVRTCA
ncbi:hypothetical protein M405DRAFT_860051 [Rhizopogon salebrosus TDB-379]|nr:hypothetical protein M405DRAFT_860051 [Rhizopogon salebrosus TDB-379]